MIKNERVPKTAVLWCNYHWRRNGATPTADWGGGAPLAAERLCPTSAHHRLLASIFPCNDNRVNVKISHSTGGTVPQCSPRSVAYGVHHRLLTSFLSCNAHRVNVKISRQGGTACPPPLPPPLVIVMQGRRNVTKSEGVSKTSTSSRAKTNPSRKHLYADLCRPRLDESFSVWKLRWRKKGKILRKTFVEKWGGHGPTFLPLCFHARTRYVQKRADAKTFAGPYSFSEMQISFIDHGGVMRSAKRPAPRYAG